MDGPLFNFLHWNSFQFIKSLLALKLLIRSEDALFQNTIPSHLQIKIISEGNFWFLYTSIFINKTDISLIQHFKIPDMVIRVVVFVEFSRDQGCDLAPTVEDLRQREFSFKFRRKLFTKFDLQLIVRYLLKFSCK
jgi:hypothetical protein